VSDIGPYLPRLPSISARAVVRLPVRATGDEKWGAFSERFSGSSPLGGGSLTKADFGLIRRESTSALDLLEFSMIGEGQMIRDVDMDSVEQFCARIARMEREIRWDREVDAEAVRAVFSDVQDELKAWEEELQMNAD
jgi:hypothetical protein